MPSNKSYLILYCLVLFCWGQSQAQVPSPEDCQEFFAKNIQIGGRHSLETTPFLLVVRTDYDYRIIFVNDDEGMKIRVLSTEMLKPLEKDDKLMFVSATGEKKVFVFFEEGERKMLNGRETFINSVVIGAEGLAWLAGNIVRQIRVVNMVEKKMYPYSLQANKQIEFRKITQCVTQEIDPEFIKDVTPIEITKTNTPVTKGENSGNLTTRKNNPIDDLSDEELKQLKRELQLQKDALRQEIADEQVKTSRIKQRLRNDLDSVRASITEEKEKLARDISKAKADAAKMIAEAKADAFAATQDAGSSIRNTKSKEASKIKGVKKTAIDSLHVLRNRYTEAKGRYRFKLDGINDATEKELKQIDKESATRLDAAKGKAPEVEAVERQIALEIAEIKRKAALEKQRVAIEIAEQEQTELDRIYEQKEAALQELLNFQADLANTRDSVTTNHYIAQQQITRSTRGVDAPEFSEDLDKMAEFYEKQGEIEKAEATYLEARQHSENFSGIDYNDYPSSLNRLANFYSNQEDYKKAEDYYLESKDILEKVFNKQHGEYVKTLTNLANLYNQTEQTDEAEKHFLEAEEHLRTDYGEAHPEYSDVLVQTASFYRSNGKQKQARSFLFKLSENLIHQMYGYYPALSDGERFTFLRDMGKTTGQFYSSASDMLKTTPDLSREMANLSLTVKGLALDGSIAARASILTAKDSVLTERYYSWLAMRRQIAQVAVMSAQDRKALGVNLESMQREANRLEGELSKASKGLAEQFANQKRQITIDSVQEQLLDGQVALDFIHFRYNNGKTWTDSVIYGATVIRKGDKIPKFVKLTTEADLKDLLGSKITVSNQNYITNERLSHEIYKQIWQPLEKHLRGAEKIAISPTGLLHQLALGSLITDPSTKKHLDEQFDLSIYGTLRDFALKKPKKPVKKDALLIGGADFDLDSVQIAEIVQQNAMLSDTTLGKMYDYMNIALPFSRALPNFTRDHSSFYYLEGTKSEVESINKTLTRDGWTTTAYVGEEALEEKIKLQSMANAPYILHVATHGYFFRPLKNSRELNAQKSFRERILYAQNPLLRSGLVVAGANRVWKGEKPVEGAEDGVLTGYEISNLDLFRTNLVVLSACETGLGDVDASEGIFGLQRAFKTAGAGNLIVSLWKVPDKETAELMDLFYKNYIKTNSIHDAFRKAQAQMRKKYAPFYWAGFVLIE